MRGGRVAPLDLAVDLPPGMSGGSTYRAQSFSLAAGDRLVLTSDGVHEAAPASGLQYGAERLDRELLEWRDHRPMDLVREVGRSVLAHAEDHLRDDATIVCLDLEPEDGR